MPSAYPSPSFPEVISVGELNKMVRRLLEGTFPLLWVAGEISNLTRAASGHWYFTLKDAQGQVRCAMFRHRNQYLDWVPENGMKVEARAVVTLYEPRGDYQLSVEGLRRSGLGALFEAFERLKAKLEGEGLFEPARKRTLPAFPRTVGIVTSPAAAALRDVLTTLRRRMPGLSVILYPAPVQGNGAAELIAEALRQAGERGECDVLILCRGGGSIEDLWAFNEEIVARAVASCPIPVISGVGHETDFTIADFVADQRAPTPTAAAEMASPDRAELQRHLAALAGRLERRWEREMEQRLQHLDHLSRRLVHPGARLASQASHLGHLAHRLGGVLAHQTAQAEARLAQARLRLRVGIPSLARLDVHNRNLARRLDTALHHQLDRCTTRLERLGANLTHLNPLAVLERGYSVVAKESGALVTDSTQVKEGEGLRITLARGKVRAKVRGTDQR